jgi:hypothetical protein
VLLRDRHLSYGRFYSQLKKQECNSREIIKLVTGVMVGKEYGNQNVSKEFINTVWMPELWSW